MTVTEAMTGKEKKNTLRIRVALDVEVKPDL